MDYLWILQQENARETWSKVCAVDLLVLEIIRPKEALAPWTVDLRLTANLRLSSFSKGYNRLLFTKNSRTEAAIALENFLFHDLQSSWRLDEALMQGYIEPYGHLVQL